MEQKSLITTNRVVSVYQTLFPIIMCMSLAACSESGSRLERDVVSKSVVDEASNAFVPTKTLVSTPDFLFKAESEVIFVVLKDGSLTGKQRVSLCHLGRRGEPDFNNCLFSGAIDSAGFSRTLSIGNDVNALTFLHWSDNARGVSVVDTWRRGDGAYWLVRLSDVGTVSF